MGTADTRREVMSSFERVFARLILEHGWAGRSAIADAVRTRSQEAGPVVPPLGVYLVARKVISSEQAQVIQSEAEQVTKSGAYAEVREDDTWIGQLLVDSGKATQAQVEEALSLQAECAAKKVAVPRLGEILIEKGVISFSTLHDALQRQSQLSRIACPTCGTRYVADGLKEGKVYLCQKCASPLTPPSSSRIQVPADAAEPEDVARAAATPANVLGKYVLVSQIGKGAMGAVYKAWDRGLRRWVSIKLLLATSDPKLVLRFRREAETAAAIQHPNIVPIYDVGESNGRPYLVMKYVEGSTLSGMSLTVDQACAMVLQAARGVALAHKSEIIHRDLKPGNVMVDGSGHVYVMDFGLAKDLYGAAGLTAPGTVMGTPSYMPPEQASGKVQAVDRSSDVYALGAVLYELLTGRPPFKSNHQMETIRQVLEDPVKPPSTLRADVPKEVEQIVLRALEKDRAKRYPTAAEFVQALEKLSIKAPSPGTPEVAPAAAAAPSRKPRAMKALFWAAVLIVLSVLAGLGVLHLIKGPPGAGN
jgi:serine/threonine-protein kinase